VQAEIAALIEQANIATAAEGHLELREVMVVHPVQTSRQARLVRVLEDAVGAVVGHPPALIASPGTYDQKHVQRIGGVAECVAYGPGILELAHQPDEYVEIEHLLQSARVMALAALDLLGWRAGSRQH
jgi:succinyl-diaminopimelate desuccinylase